MAIIIHYVQNPEVPNDLPIFNIFLYLQTKHSPFYAQPPDTHYECYNLRITFWRCKHRASSYNMYVGHLESKERLRIQPAQLFNLLATNFFFKF